MIELMLPKSINPEADHLQSMIMPNVAQTTFERD